MDFTQARAFVSRRADPASEPVVTDVTIAELLSELAVTTDADDNEPTDDGWTATYSRLGCYRVIAEIWSIKAGRLIDQFDFLAPTSGGLFKRSQKLDHCEAQERKWRAYVNESVTARAD